MTGAGGVGKTRTVLQVASTLSDAGSAVCFVALAPIGDPSSVAAAIAGALGVQEVPDYPMLETLIAYLKSKTLVLILDNCEHVAQEVAVVASALLLGCTNVRILATSRERLRTAGERAYRLPSLDIGDACELFADRARAVDAHFTLTDQNAQLVAGICQRLDGIPLAIELAAARVNVLSPETLDRKLEDRFALLARGERTALPRQQTMRASIDWSYELLPPWEQRLFERLSVFVGGSTLEAATAVYADADVAQSAVLDLVSSLVDKSLVVAELNKPEPRYRLLESFREYARERLAAHGDERLVVHRHAIVCREIVRSQLHYTQVLSWMGDCRSALRWSLTKCGDVVLGQELVGDLVTVWYSLPVEGQRWLAAANELVDERTPTTVLASLKFAESTIVGQLYDVTAALAHAEQAITLYRSVNDALGTAKAQRLAASWLGKLGHLAGSDALLEEVLATGRHLGERLFVGSALHKIAENKAKRGDIAAARRYIAEAVAAYEELGDKSRVAAALMDLGAFEGWRNDFESSVSSTKQALAIARSSNDPLTVVICLNNLATNLVLLNRCDEAEECSRQALMLAREQQLTFWVVAALGAICSITALRVRDAAKGNALVKVRVAARILGFANAYFDRSGLKKHGPGEQHNRDIAALAEAIGADELARLMAEGAAMTEEQAFEVALHL
jgi:predicted ATPase